MKFNALILSLIALFSIACQVENSKEVLPEGKPFTAPDFLLFKNLRSSAYFQTDLGNNLDSYRL